MAQGAGPERIWQPWVEFGAIGSSDLSRGEAVLFFPLTQDADTLTFFEGTGRVFQDDVREGNLAVGIRQILDRGVIVGGWAGFDVQRTEGDNTFNQLSFGVEAMTDRFDARLSGYVPLSDSELAPGLATVEQTGSRIFISGAREIPLGGVDGEVGMKLLDGGFGTGFFGDSRQELRVYAGGYYFDDDEAPEAIAGPRIRAEYRIDDVFDALPGSRLTAEARFQTDEVRGDQWSAGLSLRIPLGARGDSDALARRTAALSPLERRMTERLVREPDIVVAQGGEEDVFDTETGVAFDRVAEVGAGDDLTTVAAAAGENTLLIADGGTRDGANTLQDNQTLMGGGATIMVTGVSSGLTLPFTAQGSRPTFRNSAATPVLAIGRNNHVTGLTIEGNGLTGGAGTGNHGILGVGDLGIAVLAGNRISQIGESGIRLDLDAGTTEVRITGNTIESTGAEGIALRVANGATLNDATISGNTVTGSVGWTFEMIVEQDATATAEVSGNRFESGPVGGAALVRVRDDSNLTLEFSDNVLVSGDDRPLLLTVQRDSITRLAVTGNEFSGAGIGLPVRLFAGQNSDLDVQLAQNTTDVTLQYFVNPGSTFRLEDLLSTNTLNAGAIDFINSAVIFVPAGTFFPVP